MQAVDYFSLAVIRHRFGEPAYIIAQYLISSPYSTIPDLLKSTNIGIESICEVLASLIQHDIAICHPQRNPSRPGKDTTNSSATMRRRGASIPTGIYSKYPNHIFPSEANALPEPIGAPNTRIFGNPSAGYIKSVQRQYDTQNSLGVYRPVLPLRVRIHDTSLNIKMYRYTISTDAVRGLSRIPFYSIFIQEFYGTHVRYVIDEFGFRGRLTLGRALSCIVERIVSEEDEQLRLAAKDEAGIDPVLSPMYFNNLSSDEIKNMSIWAFNHARNMEGVDSRILQQMSHMELARYKAAAPEALSAVKSAINAHLLTVSRGYSEQGNSKGENKSNNNNNSNIFSSTTNSNDPINNTNTYIDTNAMEKAANDIIENKKRKIGIKNDPNGAAADDDTGPTVKRQVSSSSLPSAVSSPQVELPSPLSSSSSSTTTSTSSSLALASFPAITPAPTYSSTPFYVLNHDRFSLYFRAEMIGDYIAHTIGAVAGIVVGAMAYYTVCQDILHDNNTFSLDLIQSIVSTYASMKLAIVLPSPTPIPPLTSDIGQIDNIFKIHSYQRALHYVRDRGLTHAHIQSVLSRLIISPYEYIVEMTPINTSEIHYSLMYDRLVQDMRIDHITIHLTSSLGPVAARIFRLLLTIPKLEDRQLSEMALIPQKTVKEMAHKLLQLGYLDYTLVPTTTDHAPNTKTFFLWHINYPHIGQVMVDTFYRSFANIQRRLDVDYDSRSDTLDKGLVARHVELSDYEQMVQREYSTVYYKLTPMLQGMAKVILLFHDLNPY